jgi:hypothetical protein
MRAISVAASVRTSCAVSCRLQGDCNALGIFDYIVFGDDQALASIDDHAGAYRYDD